MRKNSAVQILTLKKRIVVAGLESREGGAKVEGARSRKPTVGAVARLGRSPCRRVWASAAELR